MEMLALAKKGAGEIVALQKEAVASFDPTADLEILTRLK